ncbi:MAG TPA: hypothetical protein VHQ20_02685 [Patescibacteria group bacterium]|jgi:hypothetical protein|nr:hypothetical protein [Patescibacteria group bacterium]
MREKKWTAIVILVLSIFPVWTAICFVNGLSFQTSFRVGLIRLLLALGCLGLTGLLWFSSWKFFSSYQFDMQLRQFFAMFDAVESGQTFCFECESEALYIEFWRQKKNQAIDKRSWTSLWSKISGCKL